MYILYEAMMRRRAEETFRGPSSSSSCRGLGRGFSGISLGSTWSSVTPDHVHSSLNTRFYALTIDPSNHPTSEPNNPCCTTLSRLLPSICCGRSLRSIHPSPLDPPWIWLWEKRILRNFVLETDLCRAECRACASSQDAASVHVILCLRSWIICSSS
jgi:hypothetical protein